MYKLINILIVTIFIAGCNLSSDKIVSVNGLTMGTIFSIHIVSDGSKLNKIKLESEINKILIDINNLMSTWINDSEISKINKMPTHQWIPVSDDTLYVIDLAQSVSQKTNSAFDITVGPLIQLWGFGTNGEKPFVPDDKSIKKALLRAGNNNLLIDIKKRSIYKKAPINIDLSAIAKGFAVDKIAEHLDKYNFSDYLVEVGGEIRLKGKKSGAKNWRIAIETPLSTVRKTHQIIEITNHAIATSGDYRNYFEKNGQRYSHTIDPFTGKPITHNLASVTVVSDTAAYADAIATALMVMGPEKGYEFCEKNEIAAYLIYKKNDGFKVYVTSKFKRFIVNA